MIVGNQKPIEEILDHLESRKAKKVLVVGCNTCMNVSMAGGDKEVDSLVSVLEKEGYDVRGICLRRQCEPRFFKELAGIVDDRDVIISLGCSVGAQTIAEHYPSKNVMPGVNTSNIGAPVGHGVYKERCIGCGSCNIHHTGGICTLSRCAKSLQNGPCGGSVNGKCEVSPDTDCAWSLVYESLKEKGELSNLMNPVPPRDWSKSHSGGVRTIRRK